MTLHIWQSQVEIEQYSTSVKIELTVVINFLGLPPFGSQVPVLFIASTISYTHESAFTSGCYTEYARSTLYTIQTQYTNTYSTHTKSTHNTHAQYTNTHTIDTEYTHK